MILHLVTDRRRLAGADRDVASARRLLIEQARQAIEAGVDWLQVRERDVEAADLAALVSELVALARGSATRIVVNDRLDVAIGCGAAGVHLRADSVPSASARAIAPPGFVIGQSVHSVGEAVAAEPSVDYLIAGTVWESESKPGGGSLIGVAGLAQIAASVRIPVLAIGGVTVTRLAEVARAGAAGAAGIGLFMAPAAEAHAGGRVAVLRNVVRAARLAFDTPRSGS